jgi:hypothetical protein
MNTTIKKWVGKLVLGFIAGIDVYLVDRIKSAFAKRSIRNLLNPLKSITTVLTDGNPRDEEQVDEIVRTYLNQEVPVFATGEINAALERVQNPDVKAVLGTLATPVVDMIRLLSDDNPDNEAQLKEMLRDFVGDKDTQKIAVVHILLPLVNAKVPDGPFKDMLIQIINDILLGEDGEEL